MDLRKLRQPVLLVGVPLILLLALCVIYVVRGTGAGEEDQPSGLAAAVSPHAEPDEAPATEAPATEAPDARSLVAFDLLTGVPGMRTTDGHRYLPLEGPGSGWMLAGREDGCVRCISKQGVHVAADRRPLAIRLHAAMVRGSCIVVQLGVAGPAGLEWHDSLGRQGHAVAATGDKLAAASCVPGDLKDGIYTLRLGLPEKAEPGRQVRLAGLWLVAGGGLPPATSMRPSRCDAGAGWAVQPGQGLVFPFMGRPGGEVDLVAAGAGAAMLDVAVEHDPHVRAELAPAGDGARVEKRWPLALESAMPARLVVSLPPAAPGEACLEKLDVLSAAPDAVIEGRGPAVDGVVVILVDTLRADSLRFLDDSSPVRTPVMDALAGESVVFRRATAHAAYTKPSVATMLTGVYGGKHRALKPRARLHPSVPLVTELLEEAGVDTQGVFANQFLVTREFGFWRGWKHHVQVNSFTASVGGAPVVDEVKRWTGSWEPDGPFLAYIHVMDPHAPYNPPPAIVAQYLGTGVPWGRFDPVGTSAFLRRVRRGDEAAPDDDELRLLRGLYMADVAQADRTLGRIVETLESEGILERALLVIVSDHGEEFLEHGGLGHGAGIHEELTHVPLIMRWPGGAVTGVVETPVGLVDLAPTLLDLFGVARPGWMASGRSLVELLAGGSAAWAQRAYLVEHKNTREKGVVAGDWKLLSLKDRAILARVEDGSEAPVTAADHPVAWQHMLRRLARLACLGRDEETEAVEVELDEEEVEKLKAIGYVLE